jgi:tRNA A-37 threonylcarbamoyl transferase component Bud32
LRTLDDLFSIKASEKFEKATLPDWRERLAIDLPDVDGGTRRLYVKRFHQPPGREQRRRVLAGHAWRSTAGVERHWIEALQADGVATPMVAAFGERRDGLREMRSALVLVEVPGVSLERWVRENPHRAPRAMLRALGRFIADFHAKGYIHRDLYLSHIFVDGDFVDGGEAPSIVLIDLQRVMKKPMRYERWLARDLAQLDYSTPREVAGARERLRFMRAYLNVDAPRDRGLRSLIRRVARKSARIAAREERRRSRAGGPGRRVS